MAVTFAAASVERSKYKFAGGGSVARTLRGVVKRDIEAGASNAADELIKWDANQFVGALHHAYARHLPLILRPDDLWICIAQGFAAHVNANAETLREQFVSHEGRKTLQVRRDEFVKGSASNDWPSVFSEFSDQIARHLGERRDLIVADFSTTGPVERAASEIVLMDSMKSYFTYEFLVICGIPEITLLGTAEDWRSIRHRAAKLAGFGLDWWIKALLPVLDQFVAAAEGNPDRRFWRSLYNDETTGCRLPRISGWVNALFPYVKDPRDEDCFIRNITPSGALQTFGIDSLPSGVSKTPFIWKYFGETFNMEFLGGFVGVGQNAAGALYPAIGWGICDQTREPIVRSGDTEQEAAPFDGDEADRTAPIPVETPSRQGFLGRLAERAARAMRGR